MAVTKRGRATEDRILQAYRSFVGEGNELPTAKHICRIANVGETTIRRHFCSMGALFDRALGHEQNKVMLVNGKMDGRRVRSLWTKRKIVRACRKLLTEKGITSSSLRLKMVRQGASVSGQTVRYHFRNMRNLRALLAG